LSQQLDYKALGLRVGLEIHQQLATRHKLFCHCPPTLTTRQPTTTIYRRLRLSESELGEIDPAALLEFKKGRIIEYVCEPGTACLVEQDEEPPHPINPEAVHYALVIAHALHARPVDEIHVMRKIVIDGSNTTGFQRTCIVALGGYIRVGDKTIPIQTICLEEEAARKIGERPGVVTYALDRLGIPLIEIATAPVIESPEECLRVALAIGRLLRLTGFVKRGLGTIRQDINISIRGGALTEVKGVQELALLPKVVEFEVHRQLHLIRLAEELQKRGANPEDVRSKLTDVTDCFQDTKCRVLHRAIKRGERVYAICLPKFAGLLGLEPYPGVRLGREIAAYVRVESGIPGILHSDEIRKYGVSDSEVVAVQRALHCSDQDAFIVFTAPDPETAQRAADAIVKRAKQAIQGVPEETRAARPDGTTEYMRPRPGAARMYPETDIPPYPVTDEAWQRATSYSIPTWDEAVEQLIKEFDLNKQLAEQLLDSPYMDVFKAAVRIGAPPRFTASFLTERLVALKKEGVAADQLSNEQLIEILKLLAEGRIPKDGCLALVRYLAEHPSTSVEEAVVKLGLQMLSEEEVRRIVSETITQNRDVIERRGERAVSAFMGMLMRKLRGRVDPRLLRQLVEEEVRRALTQ